MIQLYSFHYVPHLISNCTYFEQQPSSVSCVLSFLTLGLHHPININVQYEPIILPELCWNLLWFEVSLNFWCFRCLDSHSGTRRHVGSGGRYSGGGMGGLLSRLTFLSSSPDSSQTQDSLLSSWRVSASLCESPQTCLWSASSWCWHNSLRLLSGRGRGDWLSSLIHVV